MCLRANPCNKYCNVYIYIANIRDHLHVLGHRMAVTEALASGPQAAHCGCYARHHHVPSLRACDRRRDETMPEYLT